MKSVEWFRRIPWTIVLCTLGLMSLGLGGMIRGDELMGPTDLPGQQLVWILLALPVMVAVTIIPYRPIRWISYPLFVFSLGLLVLVFFLPPKFGVHRWIPLGFMYFQPSELAKLTFMLALAHYLMYRKNYRRLTGLLVPFLLTLVPVGLILREPDLGTSLVFLPVLFAMLFAAGAKARHLIVVSLLGVATLPVLWLGMSSEQKSRVVSLIVQTDGGPVPRGDGYHLHQSKQMLALGGVWGSDWVGDTLDERMLYHLPESRTDFIFCLVGERWGLIGTCLTLLLYAILFARGLMIAATTKEPFGRLLAVGIVALLACQTVINTGMTVGLMPITGMTLPLLSYGGSSLLMTCLALGLLINVGMRPGYEMTSEPFRFTDKHV